MLRAVLIALGLLAVSGAAHAATEDDFVVVDTDDLVSLCSATPDSPNGVEAINFCHGYAVGAFQYYQLLEPLSPDHQFICLLEPKPSRNEVIAGFVAWARAHPHYAGAAAVETLFRYLGETFPCKK